MAMIQKIRDQSNLLIGVIGVALVLFLLGGDFLSSGGGNGDNVTTILEVNGTPIPYAEFDAKVQDQIKRNYGTGPVNEQTRESVRNQMYNLLLNEKVMNEEYNKLGLNVNPDEIFDQVRNNPSPLLAQFFTNPQTGKVYEQLANPLGQIDGEKVLFTVKQMLNNPEGEQNWLAIEEALKADRYNTKYNNLLKKGLIASTAEAKADLDAKANRLTFDYVMKDYSEIADNTIEVSDAELNAYYNAHKNETFFQQKEATRSIEYVAFDVTPSKSDIAELEQEIKDIKANFLKETDDTSFVREFAETPIIGYFSKGSFPTDMDSLILAGDSGQVFGPYTENGYYKLAKVLAAKTSSDSAEARHILVKIVDGDTAKAQALVDSLVSVIKSQNNFEAMVTEFSEDFGSAQDGGSLGWFTEGRMVPEFNDACFSGEVGDMPVVTSQFGIHLIEITGKTAPKEKKLVAIVDRKIEPSKNTFDNMYNVASKFSIDNNNQEAFRKAGNSLGIKVADFLRETDKNIAGLDGARDLVRWAFKSEEGDVSEPFEFGNKFVVANLKEKRAAGVLTLATASVKEKVKAEVIKEKKAEKFIAEMSKSNSLASAGTIKTANNVLFSSSSIPGAGTERKLLGAVFSVEKGMIAKPVSDNRGVYLAEVKSVTNVPQNSSPEINKVQLSRNFAARVDYELFKALEKTCDITDNRSKFY